MHFDPARDTDSTVSIPSRSKPTVVELRNRTMDVLRQVAPADIPQFLSTEQLAELLHIKAATIRRAHSMDGHYNGLKPVKMPNGRLIWKIDA